MAEHLTQVDRAHDPAEHASPLNGLSKRLIFAAVNLAATIHIVWFYLALVPSYMRYEQYEQGLEKTPFQHRILMMYPLRWAHRSTWLNDLASRLTALSAWFPYGVRAEQLVEAVTDCACVLIAGLVARSLYMAASRTRMLTPYVYPLTLAMVAATYTFYTMHRWRFLYDLPSLGFFSIGLYLIYFRRSRLLFAVLFVVATINRETTFFLLILYLLAERSTGSPSPKGENRRGFSPSTLLLLAGLSLFWIVWHLWIARQFAGNVSESWSRVWLNVGIVLWPTSWAQILSVFAFCGPLVLLSGGRVADATLRSWRWILPIWFLFMLRFGIFLETRIFGELIPYMACMTALLVEQNIFTAWQDRPGTRVLSGVDIAGATADKVLG